ncbi:MAG: ferritin-like domain-containing protein [Minicystis sp.]
MDRVVDLGGLAFDQGGHLLVKRALLKLPAGERVEVRGRDPHLAVHLRAFCRAAGHGFVSLEGGPLAVVRGAAANERWAGAERAGGVDPTDPAAVVERPPARWGLAARGALVEAGAPAIAFPLDEKVAVWSDEAPRLYAQAAAAQWDPESAIPWSSNESIPDEIEDAVVQIMTYLVENENAALLVPARFLGRMHPHFREVMAVLAVQVADEARHVEVFTRRARLRRAALGTSAAGGQASLGTLFDEPDFAVASFLLSVLGEGSFLSLLWFLHAHGPDPITREVARLAAQDEARHVAFGLSHLGRHAEMDPGLRARLAAAAERRHEALRQTAGLNEEVFDALVLVAAGSWDSGGDRAGARGGRGPRPRHG